MKIFSMLAFALLSLGSAIATAQDPKTCSELQRPSETDPIARRTAAREHQACTELLATGTSSFSPAAADLGPSRNEAEAATAARAAVAAREAEIESETLSDFMGLKWGVGFGWSFSNDDVVDEAIIVNGVVRATQNKSDVARAVFEYHDFLGCKRNRGATTFRGTTKPTKGCGPFIAVAASGDDLTGVGMGWMWGWRSDPESADGFSFGIGAVLDNDVKSLAPGFEDGRPLPAGESEIRFEEEARWSALLFFSRTFSFAKKSAD